MRITPTFLLAVAAGLLATAFVRATGQTTMSCCGGMAGCCGLTTATAATTASPTADSSTLPAPVKSVYGHYLKIQSGLANDSLDGVSEDASAIASAVKSDAKALPAELGTQADALAKATDLRAARVAFKSLSDSLIKYLADNKAKDAYVQVYCPMARANWLQADKNVSNPYFGQAMARCGEIVD